MNDGTDSTIHMALSTECVCDERNSHLSNWRYYYRNCLSATITVNPSRQPYVSERELRMFVIGYYSNEIEIPWWRVFICRKSSCWLWLHVFKGSGSNLLCLHEARQHVYRYYSTAPYPLTHNVFWISMENNCEGIHCVPNMEPQLRGTHPAAIMVLYRFHGSEPI